MLHIELDFPRLERVWWGQRADSLAGQQAAGAPKKRPKNTAPGQSCDARLQESLSLAHGAPTSGVRWEDALG